MRGVFDIIGPVMIGPSSSHTAGAVRLGRMARALLGEEAISVEIFLHGSFGQTYRGHGTDKALIAGILGFETDDERIKIAPDFAVRQGIHYEISQIDLGEAHPNTAVIELRGKNRRKTRVIGSSIGGGNIRITKIDDYDVELTGKYATLVTMHQDRPGVITQVTNVLAKYEMNIAFMRVARKTRGAQALMMIEIDDILSDEVLEEINQVSGVENAFGIPPV